MRASISERGRPRFSSPKASSSRTVSFDADSWLAGVENTIPTRDPTEQLARRGGHGFDALDRDPTVELRPDDPRDEPGSHQGER